MTKGSAEKFYKGREKKGGGRTRVRLKKMEAKYVKNKRQRTLSFQCGFPFLQREWQRGGRGLVATEHRAMDYRQNFNSVLIIYLLLGGKRLPVHNTLSRDPYSRCVFA